MATYLGDRRPDSRYASFDYCFNYFQTHREADEAGAIAQGEALQVSCLHLGFYLASWGMLRGSSELLRRSVRVLVPVVETLASAPPALWEADADKYSEDTVAAIVGFAGELRRSLATGASDILVTKILLGTMGCVPAFDSYFKKGFGVASFGHKSLRKVGQFYRENTEAIEAHRRATLDFDTAAPTQRRYTRAKVIDMVFFVQGMS